jgi:hypothetical protein
MHTECLGQKENKREGKCVEMADRMRRGSRRGIKGEE